MSNTAKKKVVDEVIEKTEVVNETDGAIELKDEYKSYSSLIINGFDIPVVDGKVFVSNSENKKILEKEGYLA